jgi:hypothetical protein
MFTSGRMLFAGAVLLAAAASCWLAAGAPSGGAFDWPSAAGAMLEAPDGVGSAFQPLAAAQPWPLAPLVAGAGQDTQSTGDSGAAESASGASLGLRNALLTVAFLAVVAGAATVPLVWFVRWASRRFCPPEPPTPLTDLLTREVADYLDRLEVTGAVAPDGAAGPHIEQEEAPAAR